MACAALRLAVLLPTASSWAETRASAGAIALAVADMNEKFKTKLSYKWEEIDCDAVHATAAISRMLHDDIVDAVIGPDCEFSCETSAVLTAMHDVAQISYSCCSDALYDKMKYPTVESRNQESAPPPPSPLRVGTRGPLLLGPLVVADYLVDVLSD